MDISGPYKGNKEELGIGFWLGVAIFFLGFILTMFILDNKLAESELQKLQEQKQTIEQQNANLEMAISETIDEVMCTLKEIDCFEYQYTMIVELSAYNLVPEQTSGDPCIGAYGDDLCNALENGIYPAASTVLKYGTLFEWNERIYQVLDVSGTPSRLDIAFSADQIEEAIEFGVKHDQEIQIIKII